MELMHDESNKLCLAVVLALGVAGCSNVAKETGTGGGTSGPGGSSGTAGSGGSTGSGTDGATTTSGSTAGTGASGTSSGSFVLEIDAGAPDCDLWAQDCPDGEKCMPWADDGGNSWNAAKCVPVDAMPKQPGDPCTAQGGGVSGVDDCDKAAMCWNIDPMTGMGTCVAFCGGSEADPVCSPENTCVIANEGFLILCLPSCDPLTPACAPTEVCIPNPADEGFACVLDASGAEGQVGDPCEYANACDPGLLCANADVVPDCMGTIGCCAEFCDITAPACTQAADGAECTPFYEAGMVPPGGEEIGVCMLPP
jgi:hypothetical protein